MGIFYSHGTANFFSTTIGFLGSKYSEVVEMKSNEKGRILIPDMTICD